MYRALEKPKTDRKIVLTERDKLWVRAVHRFRFLTTDQAQVLAGSPNRNDVNDRLALLWAHDYLDRPKVQLEAYAYAKKRHTVHALGQRGAEWLAENDGVQFPKGKGWATANKLKSSERLSHQIGVVDTVLAFDGAIGKADGLSLSHHDEVLASLSWPPGLKAHRLPTRVRQNGVVIERGTDPDYVLSIAKAGKGKSLCFLEWDNATESFIKADRVASSIAQKHLCYADAYQRKLHTELYGSKNMRVLFVVQGSNDRVEKMREVCERVVPANVPKGIFWYTTHDQLMAQSPLGDIWITGDGKRLALA